MTRSSSLLLLPLCLVACTKTAMNRATPKDAAANTLSGAVDVSPETSGPDAGNPCATSSEVCRRLLCLWPLDWQQAHNPSEWCAGDGKSPPVSISLCRTVDGYDRVWITYEMGGEFVLYDPVTGEFVQRRGDAKTDYACEIGIPGGPSEVDPTCAGPETTIPMVCDSHDASADMSSANPDGDAGDGPSADWSAPDGFADTRAFRAQTDAFNGWLGGSCQINADCTGSPAATALVGLACPSQLFCLDGLCHAECIDSCAVIAGVPSCLPPRFCVGFATSGGISFCRITPLICTTTHDCPLSPGPVDGGATWSCEDGICKLPDFEYPTR